VENFTANETWINKLVDELVDAKDELISESIKSNDLYTLREIIFNNTRLAYGEDGLRIEGERAILEYLRAIYPDCYNKRLAVLKKEREEDSDNG
jgi:hypothetical protein